MKGFTLSGLLLAAKSVLDQRCPSCHRGRVFSGFLEMKDSCDACGYRFEREPGYFVGAMYVSYAMAVGAYAGLVLLFQRLLPALSPAAALGAAFPPFLLLVPVIFRYSRVIWMHFDRYFDRKT